MGDKIDLSKFDKPKKKKEPQPEKKEEADRKKRRKRIVSGGTTGTARGRTGGKKGPRFASASKS